jgi:acetyl-CoA carboxylase biotin carboxyl carrier protein
VTAVENGAAPHVAPQQLRPDAVLELCDAAAQLARNLPAPLHRLALRAGEYAVELEFALADQVPGLPGAVAVSATAAAAADRSDEGTGDAAAADGVIVRAPLVGTFYVAPSPGAEPFVRVGDEIEAGQPVGIVEAMKLMNQVVTEVGGTVVRIVADDASPVEYDQPLIEVDPGGV